MSKRMLWTLVALVLVGGIALRGQQPQGQAPGRGGRGGQVTLPDGPGKASVEAYCTRCHNLGNIVNSGGFTKQGWEELTSTMIEMPADQRSVIADYLAKNFPEQPRPPAVLIPGPAKVSFKEWDLPTLGSRPHD